jgi:hypothetical protein
MPIRTSPMPAPIRKIFLKRLSSSLSDLDVETRVVVRQ